ncbi:MAG: indolepyruvate oxidoreductase subunit beta family protein [bacterium]
MSAADEGSAATVLISALGGEGGAVLTRWIVNAAQASDLPVQATSIPGVAQRTGATTYYLEIWRRPWSELGGQTPVLGLIPAPGEVDLMAATELLEVGRAVRAGLITPERTVLIGSTHRVFTTAEKMVMEGGGFETGELLEAARQRSASSILFDIKQLAAAAAVPLNAVLLGAIAARGKLPLGEEPLREGIRAEGINTEANLRGFEAGLAAARQQAPEQGPPPEREEPPGPGPDGLARRIEEDFPPAARGALRLGVERLVDYQDRAYAGLYLDRLAPFAQGPAEVLAGLARLLAVRMSFEDIIRVAQAKVRPERLARIRAETGAGPGEPVEVTEFFKPGFEEFRDIMPQWMARPAIALARRRPRLANFRWSIHLRSTTVWGYARLRMLAGLRRWRRRSWRFHREQEAIGAWLELVEKGAARDARLAAEIAECARLVRGYGDTHRRGVTLYESIVEALIRPALENGADPARAATAIAAARKAALADPEGEPVPGGLAG